MPRIATPLTEADCKAAKPRAKDYSLFDGGGLYLLVSPGGTKRWRMKYKRVSGVESVTTFGRYPEVSLREARQKRDVTKVLIQQGIDPNAQKRELKLQAREQALHHEAELQAELQAREEALQSHENGLFSGIVADLMGYAYEIGNAYRMGAVCVPEGIPEGLRRDIGLALTAMADYADQKDKEDSQ